MYRVEASDFLISITDIDAILRKLGNITTNAPPMLHQVQTYITAGSPRNQKELEFLLWEADENNDGSIDWDEFQLTYYRSRAASIMPDGTL